MNYSLEFMPKALKEWKKLDPSVRMQFYKKLKERLENPRVPKDRLHGYRDIYKIKLRSSGFRLAYQVREAEIVVLVLSVGKRENDSVYDKLRSRLS